MKQKLRTLRKGSPDDWPTLALIEFTVALARAMKASGNMKQKDLAEKLGVSRPYISSIMSGNENLTIEQMSRLAAAVGGSLHVTIAPRGLWVKWAEDVLEAPQEPAITSAPKLVSQNRPSMESPSTYSWPTMLSMPSQSASRHSAGAAGRKLPPTQGQLYQRGRSVA